MKITYFIDTDEIPGFFLFRGAKTVQLPVTFSMNGQIFTSILFPSLKNIQEDLPKSRKVMLKSSLTGKKMQTLKKRPSTT